MQYQQKLDYTLINKIIAKLFVLCFRKIILIEHKENLIQAPCPIIFAYNHNNYYETIFLCSYLVDQWRQGKISFVVDWMYGRLPFLSWLMQGLDPVYVYTKRARWEFLNRWQKPAQGDILTECLQRLRQGRSLGIFPEGTRNRHPFQLKRGRRGVGEIALHSQTPVMPVGIDFPCRGRGHIPGFGKIIFRFGEPLYFPDELAAWRQVRQDLNLTPEERKKIRVNLAKQITHKIMTRLAILSGKRYPFPEPPVLTPLAFYSGKLE